MTLPKRRLQGTDLDVSVLCYGPMRIATDKNDLRRGEHARAMEAAIDGGVNFIHSSYEYGVRWLMHDVLKNHPSRHDLHHVIKVPVPDWDDKGFDAEKYEARIDEALRDLCCDRISLVQWMWRVRPHHEAHRLPLLEDCIEAVQVVHERLREKGKVAHLATFPYFPQSAAKAMAAPGMSSLIAYYNLLELEMSPVLDLIGEEDDGRGFIAIRPLYEGILTDRYLSYDALPDDHRLKKENYLSLFERRDALMDALPEIAQTGLTKFALQFPLLSENCASVVVGLNNEAQVNQSIELVEEVRPNPSLVKKVRDAADRLSANI